MFFCCVCVFFFKQKTAYEMRISDWSSDVCSSDLLGRQMCDHLVRIHVGRGTGPRLEHVDRKLRVVQAIGYLQRAARNRLAAAGVEQAKLAVDLRGSRLDQAQRTNERTRH